jgi:HPt (histidine-containing phosphotransfer) domain-containing protein
MKTNLTYLKGMSGDNFEIIKEMIGIFIEQVQEMSETMNSCLNNKDWTTLGKLAHKAKSSVSIMGMEELATKLKELEHSAAEGKDIENYAVIVQKFESDCAEAIGELNTFINV